MYMFSSLEKNILLLYLAHKCHTRHLLNKKQSIFSGQRTPHIPFPPIPLLFSHLHHSFDQMAHNSPTLLHLTLHYLSSYPKNFALFLSHFLPHELDGGWPEIQRWSAPRRFGGGRHHCTTAVRRSSTPLHEAVRRRSAPLQDGCSPDIDNPARRRSAVSPVRSKLEKMLFIFRYV